MYRYQGRKNIFLLCAVLNNSLHGSSCFLIQALLGANMTPFRLQYRLFCNATKPILKAKRDYTETVLIINGLQITPGVDEEKKESNLKKKYLYSNLYAGQRQCKNVRAPLFFPFIYCSYPHLLSTCDSGRTLSPSSVDNRQSMSGLFLPCRWA